MSIQVDFNSLKAKVNQQSLILTPNLRTQQAIVNSYIKELQIGEVLESPRVLSFSQWQKDLCNELSFHKPLPGLLSDLQIKFYFKKIIASEKSWQLTNPSGLADLALSAYKNLCLWDLNINQIKNLYSIENHYFIKWTKSFEEFCKAKNYLAEFNRIQILSDQLERLKDKIPENILLFGFNQLSPIEEKFLNQLKNNNCRIEKYFPEMSRQVSKAASQQKRPIIRYEFENLNQELLFAANQAKQLLIDKPQASIGIVVNQLSQQVDLVHDIFSQVFHPQESKPNCPMEKIAYNVSAGQSLLSMPLINAANKLFGLHGNLLTFNDLLFIKNTPFINWQEQQQASKYFLHQLCLQARAKYSIDYLLYSIESNDNKQQLSLLKTRLTELQKNKTKRMPLDKWVEYFKQQLLLWGVISDADQSRLLESFYQVLHETKNNLIFQQQIPFNEASEYLLQTLAQAKFQLPSDRSNIQVLGVLEASGLLFNQLILVGFNATNWPQKFQLNPLIPADFQKQHKMPMSSVERELAYTSDLSQSLLNSAPQIFITQSRLADYSSITESPLFAEFPLQDLAVQDNNLLQADADYEWLQDEKLTYQIQNISGGSYFIGEYADCPFKAFANGVLKLQLLETLAKGIDPMTRGNWLHYTMQLIWDELINQQKLLALDVQQLERLVEEKLDLAQKKYQFALISNAQPEIIHLEKQKLKQNILQWLELEKQSEAFTAETEVAKSLSLGALNLKIRCDRLDKNQNNQIHIMDYKTGNAEPKDWFGSRPVQAQMPIYALAFASENIQSLSYAKPQPGNPSRAGIWFDENDFKVQEQTHDQIKSKRITNPDILPENKQALMQYWKQNLELLANHIIDGVVPVSPKSANSCSYCVYQDFCRINESQPEDSLIEEKAQV